MEWQVGTIGLLTFLDLSTAGWLFINFVVTDVGPHNPKEFIYPLKGKIMGTSTKRLPTQSLSELFTAHLSRAEIKEVKEKYGPFWLEILVLYRQKIRRGLNCWHGNLFPSQPLSLLSLCRTGEQWCGSAVCGRTLERLTLVFHFSPFLWKKNERISFSIVNHRNTWIAFFCPMNWR